jgi:hypothetical protein
MSPRVASIFPSSTSSKKVLGIFIAKIVFMGMLNIGTFKALGQPGEGLEGKLTSVS